MLLSNSVLSTARSLAGAVLICASISLAVPPTVSNVRVAPDSANKLVTITYQVSDPDTAWVGVTLQVSTNDGASFNVVAGTFKPGSQVGSVAVGSDTKTIVWDAGTDWNNRVSDRMRVSVTADDTVPYGMVLIPAGSFVMGNDTNRFPELDSDELPLHTVPISAFYMDRHEVTHALWSNVHAWAVTHGYAFDNAGSGKAPTHPVHTVNWYDCVKWCNARSEREGRTPCYYTSATLGTVYRTGALNLSNNWVNWTANGYRLPTEAEWEKAARGGTPGHRFPWSDADTIQHARANYNSSSSYAYDTSPTRGYHPTFNDGVYPYTSPVGYFAANGYGLYDMAGNVWEWCWDWYGSTWYSNAGATQSDTRGPATGAYRVLRGGSWVSLPYLARCAYRSTSHRSTGASTTGFGV